ncbi:MAG TPA: hypothetical protein VHO70_04140, partial [Chitinispirillaceae bacterium]|nr:hypothetical protein [Chitinispirillaceae bacterium]
EGYTPGKHISKRTVEKIYTKACEKQCINSQGGIHSLRHYVESDIMGSAFGLCSFLRLFSFNHSP